MTSGKHPAITYVFEADETEGIQESANLENDSDVVKRRRPEPTPKKSSSFRINTIRAKTDRLAGGMNATQMMDNPICVPPDKSYRANYVSSNKLKRQGCVVGEEGIYENIKSRKGCYGEIHVFMVADVDTIPVVGGNTTLICTYSPKAPDREVRLKDGSDSPLASLDCENGICQMPPNEVSIKGDLVRNLTANETTDVTCIAKGARPPASLQWIIPKSVQFSYITRQTNVIRENSYVSLRKESLRPSRDAHGVRLICKVLHPQLHEPIEKSVLLNVEAPPTSVEISIPSRPIRDDGTGVHNIIIFKGTLTNITCTSNGSRPVANISWTLNANEISNDVTSHFTYNPVDDSFYDTTSVMQIQPARRHHNQALRCLARVGKTQLETEARLLVYETSDPPEIHFPNKLVEGDVTNVTCSTDNGYPQPLIRWYIGSRNITNQSWPNQIPSDHGRADITSVLEFTPAKSDNGRNLTCEIIQEMTFTASPRQSQKARKTLDILYPPVIHELTFRQLVTDVTFTCRSDASPPASQFTWFRNGSSLDASNGHQQQRTDHHEGNTTSSSKLTIQHVTTSDQGKYKCEASTNLGRGSSAINYTFASTPQAPSNLIVHQKQTTFSTITVAWQPGFYGGVQQTHALQCCTHEKQDPDHEECYHQTGINSTNYTLRSLKPYTRYEIILWSANSAGNSSQRKIVASTAPLTPIQYGVYITRKKSEEILTISNTDQPIEDLCFVILRNRSECSSLNETKCFDPGTKVNDIDPDDDLAVVTFGRGLCSEPSNSIGMIEAAASKIPFFLGIIWCVVAASIVILLLSLGLLFSVRRCFFIKKTDNPRTEIVSRPRDSQTLVDGNQVSSNISQQEHNLSVRALPAIPKPRITHTYNTTVQPEGDNEDQRVESVAEGDEEEFKPVIPDIASTSQKRNEDGLVYIDLSHDRTDRPLPTQRRFTGGITYASLDREAMTALKTNGNIPSPAMPNEDSLVRTDRNRDSDIAHVSGLSETDHADETVTEKSVVTTANKSNDKGARKMDVIQETSVALPVTKRLDEDGMIYLDISHNSVRYPRPALDRSREGTVYASLDYDVMETHQKENASPSSSTKRDPEDLVTENDLLYINISQ
ncbi:uncharacterized protein LOC135155209 [Lytechinus pictus]|uniref:uncharacterized protein LOC135155209 n=1 Tax=Lytechinus pictus TaxID=7653 RepID=UPI0030B9B8DD